MASHDPPPAARPFCLRIAQEALRHWHLVLLQRLGACPGWKPEILIVPAAARPVSPARRLLDLDGRLRRAQPQMGRALPPGSFDAFRVGTTTDGAVLLDPDDVPATAGTWHLAFNGQAGEDALLALLAQARTPRTTLLDGSRVLAEGRLGTEYRGALGPAFEDVLHRLVTLVLATLTGAGPALPALPPGEDDAAPPGPVTPGALAKFLVKQPARMAVRTAYRLAFDSPHWRIGWRRLDGPDLVDSRRHPDSGWHSLPDDGRRFYADPFPIVHRDQIYLFVEEFPHRLGRGLISVVPFGRDGPQGTPQPVLDLPYHLSYPFVFEGDGEMWMIPESCAAGTIDLYRAQSFPGGWVKHATLVSDVVASDATLLRHGGMWWLFATVRGPGGAFSDALHLWHAPDFRGPWQAHAGNPVVIDSASARPAGRIVARNGQLIRPVQDCRNGYGAALGLARIDRLDEGGYAQTVETIVRAGPLWPGTRLHSLNAAGGLEFIDGSARVRRRP